MLTRRKTKSAQAHSTWLHILRVAQQPFAILPCSFHHIMAARGERESMFLAITDNAWRTRKTISAGDLRWSTEPITSKVFQQ